MSVVISVENVSKQYRLGEVGTGTLSHDVNRWWHKIRGKEDPYLKVGESNDRSKKGESEYSWALRDISFEVKQGEVLGIIGRNGAGKSTLLKVLSRVTTPTTGQIKVKGRIASLLEVGTGFHPELTGRENIFLNGAILGMRKAEIATKFDEIVDFSGCERYIDTPVKRYSSGMYVRLAFAVAAHLEPEILIVDEVLAVGDAEFQKKCLGKMKDVAGQGRTVLFVSHNMAAVKTLCSEAVHIANGRLIGQGSTTEIISKYLQTGQDSASEREWRDPATAPGNENIRMESVRVLAPPTTPEITIDSGAEIQIQFFNANRGINLDCTVYLLNNEGLILFETGKIISSNNDSEQGRYKLTATLPEHLLNCGKYVISIVFGKDQYYPIFRIDEVVSFNVENSSTGRGSNMSAAPGIIRPLLKWKQELITLPDA
jgi:lipopolysaccharide transport system ATP-binding protein